MTGLKWKTRNKWWQNRNQWPKLIIHPVLYIFKSSMQHIHLLNLKHGEEHYQNTLGLNLTYKMKLTLSGTSTHFSMQWRETEIHGWHEETSFHFLLLFSENIVSLEIMVTTHNPSFFQISDQIQLTCVLGITVWLLYLYCYHLSPLLSFFKKIIHHILYSSRMTTIP
jgi:hypothetical protein